MATRLVTSRYVKPGTYIGQIIVPRPGNLSADSRICDYIGQGSRLAVGSNLGIRRSFVYAESLSLPNVAPFVATLTYPADGSQDLPVRIFDSITGLELRNDQWAFQLVGDDYLKVIISPDAYSSTADYKIDYQSVSTQVMDPLPVQDLRFITALGNNPDRVQYKDFVDFFVPFQYTGPTAGSSNSTPAPFLTSVFPDGGNTGGGAVAISPSAAFLHNYNRFYELTVTAISGVSGSYTATFEWSARRYSGGVDALPPTPLDTASAKPSFTALEAVPLSLTQTLELGIKVDFSFGPSNYAVGDKFYFNAVGPGLFELDGRYTNTNQYLEFSSIVPTLQSGSTGSLSYSAANTYNGTYNAKYRVKVESVAGSGASRSAVLSFASYGEIIGPTGTVAVSVSSPTTLLAQGVEITADFGATHFVVGDQFDFGIDAPRAYYQAKDDRVIKMTVGSATNPGADVGQIVGSYSTGTPEGGFGSFESDMNLLTGPTQETGFFVLPDNISVAARNMIRGSINGTSYATSDEFTLSVSSLNVLDWSLTKKATELRETTAVFTDVTGQVTGSPGSPYVILNNVYMPSTVSVVDEATQVPISFFEVPGTRFLGLMSVPTDTIQIDYEYRGEEPVPGQLYYMTAAYLRPSNLYDNPQLILDRQDGRTLLAPSEITNHLYIMNELVFDNNAAGAYYTQCFDADGDGIITRTDVQRALLAHTGLSRATDLCVLSQFEALSDSLSVNEQANDPFEKREQMLWVGAPIGTPVGDVDTPNTLIFLARRTLQTSPQSPAQGTRVLLAPTTATKTIQLANGLSQSVTLDGSFVAGATSALVNSFADPATTILRKNLSGFDTMQVYPEPQELLLGNASITFLSDQGNSVFRFEEDVTVSTIAEEFQLISATIQKQFVTKVVRREMDQALISVVTPNAQSAIALIRSTLAGILVGLLGRGLIADYQDEDGNVREFDPNSDIVIIRDTQSLTLFNFYYSYWIRSPIKRLFGLYRVNSNDFGLGTGT